jgi:8-oxo-dGTP pyrophosphatase MutT (NUDIX family)
MTDRPSLREAILGYQTHFAEEAIFIDRFLQLLEHPRCFHRDHLPGHITASAFISDHTRAKLLLTHHAKLNRWLQPGGHADGDENVIAIAHREAFEETGLTSLKLASSLFDLDIHTIPQSPDFPEHDHYDIRFHFVADATEEVKISAESHDVAWIDFQSVPELTNHNLSILRMLSKL